MTQDSTGANPHKSRHESAAIPPPDLSPWQRLFHRGWKSLAFFAFLLVVAFISNRLNPTQGASLALLVAMVGCMSGALLTLFGGIGLLIQKRRLRAWNAAQSRQAV